MPWNDLLRPLPLVLAFASTPAGAQESPQRQVPKPDTSAPDTKKPVQVFVLMGQSNMVGMGEVGPETTRGTLSWLCREQGSSRTCWTRTRRPGRRAP